MGRNCNSVYKAWRLGTNVGSKELWVLEASLAVSLSGCCRPRAACNTAFDNGNRGRERWATCKKCHTSALDVVYPKER